MHSLIGDIYGPSYLNRTDYFLFLFDYSKSGTLKMKQETNMRFLKIAGGCLWLFFGLIGGIVTYINWELKNDIKPDGYYSALYASRLVIAANKINDKIPQDSDLSSLVNGEGYSFVIGDDISLAQRNRLVLLLDIYILITFSVFYIIGAVTWWRTFSRRRYIDKTLDKSGDAQLMNT